MDIKHKSARMENPSSCKAWRRFKAYILLVLKKMAEFSMFHYYRLFQSAVGRFINFYTCKNIIIRLFLGNWRPEYFVLQSLYFSSISSLLLFPFLIRQTSRKTQCSPPDTVIGINTFTPQCAGTSSKIGLYLFSIEKRIISSHNTPFHKKCSTS